MAGVSLESQLPLRGGGQGAASPAIIVTSSLGKLTTSEFCTSTALTLAHSRTSMVIWTGDMRLQNYHWPQYLGLVSSFLSAKNKTQLKLNSLFEEDGLKIIQYEGVT